MGTVEQLSQLAFDANQAKHLGINGLDVSLGSWIPVPGISSSFDVVNLSQSAVYASASSFTVPFNITAYVQKGDKIRWTQPTLGVKYGHIYSAVYSAPNTTITIPVNTDYTVANEAITDFYISRAHYPWGFPNGFNWAPTLVGFSANPTNTVYQYSLDNKTCALNVRQTTAGTSNATSFTISLPITASTVPNGVWGVVNIQAFDNGVELAAATRSVVGSAGTVITLQSSLASGAWTAANGKMASFTDLRYPI